jgi:hypothetical protein
MAVSWIKKGSDSANIAKQEEAEAQKRKEESGKMWRFYLKATEEARITFVDGDLSPEGFLLPPRFYEHNLYLNGSFGNLFVCPEKTNPESGDKCPICEMDDRPSLVALFTIIDHRVVQSKDKTKTYTNTPKLLVAKSGSFEMLNKLAHKLGGLAGQSFDVSRSASDKAPAIGDLYIPLEKNPVADLMTKYVVESVDPKSNKKIQHSLFVAANYEEEIVYRTADDLRKMGFGKAGVTGMSHPTGQTSQGKTNYEKQL